MKHTLCAKCEIAAAFARISLAASTIFSSRSMPIETQSDLLITGIHMVGSPLPEPTVKTILGSLGSVSGVRIMSSTTALFTMVPKLDSA